VGILSKPKREKRILQNESLAVMEIALGQLMIRKFVISVGNPVPICLKNKSQ
jgi:hypothetical protein